MFNEVILLLGSNLDEKSNVIKKAISLIKERYEINKISSEYISEPWGFKSKNNFINVAVKLLCKDSAFELLKFVLKIERDLGRTRNTSKNYSDRIIDIDIMLFGNELIETSNLVIPHGKLVERRFCLLPMVEIASNTLIPDTKLTLAQALSKCKDKGEVIPI
jgi:2-amino-4-hydroxy-6-hydroxymethyldihydropteridine diphosphokinase